ncbi:MAG: tetratricopeptide repeat protein, partial [Betaproteobacteria bacterium]|nr:tetratricopeptide repeat protein [Betaproteobacteria bacterium]
MPERSAQEIWINARAAHQGGRLDEAVEQYTLLSGINPGSYAVQYNLGLALQELGHRTEAIQAYQRALQLNSAFAEAHTNLANLLQAVGESAPALAHYRAALIAKPDLTLAALNLANLAFDLGKDMEALQNYVHVLRYDTSCELAWSRMFSLAFALRQKRVAIEMFPAWARNPRSLRQLAAGLVVSRLTGDSDLEQQMVEGLAAFGFDHFTQQDLFPILGNLPYFEVPQAVRHAFYRRHASLFDAMQPLERKPLPTLPGQRIRIGYVSADFRRHVMGRIMLDVCRFHDPRKFEIHLFSVCPAQFHDGVTQAFRGAAKSFHDISALDDLAAAKVISDTGLDILVDLLGHTQEAKSGIFAHKPGPIQLTHLGYHGCVGMEQIDFKVTDRIADTRESLQGQIEKPMFLDTCVMPFSSVPIPAAAPSRDELRAKYGLQGAFAIGCFVNLMKLSPRCLRLWARIAAKQPHVKWVFSLYDPGDNEIAAGLMARHGIPRQQLTFLPTETDEGLQRARYRAIDLVLDTFPYTGGDTTVAALDMDIPVVTLKGSDHASRMGWSILWHLGLSGTVANDDDEFVSIGARLIEEPAFLEAQKEEIRCAKRVAPSAR